MPSSEASKLTRREALATVVASALLVATPPLAKAAPVHSKEPFTPENDYPFFDYNPESVK